MMKLAKIQHFKGLIILFTISSFFGCNSNNVQHTTETINDAELITYLKTNQAEFDTLCNWMITDKNLEFMLPRTRDTCHLNSITQERADRYFALMKKLNIENIARGNANRNGIIFYFREIKENDKIINKGYMYRINLDNDFKKDWIRTDAETINEARKYELNTFVYKPINDHWSLIGLIQ